MDFVEELRRFRARASRQYAALIIPGSGQPTTAALLIGALRPARVAFLLTPESADLPEQVASLLGAAPDGWERYARDHTDTLQIYRSLREIIDAWADLPRQKIAVDLTGGTKPMSVGLAKAAYVLGIDALYIESDFTVEAAGRRVLIAGSQRLAPPPDPYLVFGDLEAAEAARLFNAHDYAGAGRVFAELARRVPPPDGERYAALESLAAAYTAWDAFDLRAARDAMGALLAQPLPEGLAGHRATLAAQGTALEVLVDVAARAAGRGAAARDTLAAVGDVLPLLGSLHANAGRREAQGRYDTAALLRYRCLELISQHRLATWGLLTERPDVDTLRRHVPGLEAAYRAVEEQVGFRPRGLPQPNRGGAVAPIALFGGYMLLAALADPLLDGFAILQIRERSEARNKSILAHGYRLITADEYAQFAEVVDALLDRLFLVIGHDRAAWERDARFIELQ